jgi:hypothetical protein
MKLIAKTPSRRSGDAQPASPPVLPLSQLGRCTHLQRSPLQLLRQGVWALRALRLNSPPGSQGWEALVASERLLMLEIRDTYGEAASMLTDEYPYLDHRSLSSTP